MDELKVVLGYLYDKFGTNDVTLALSEYVDGKIILEQREILKKIDNRGEN